MTEELIALLNGREIGRIHRGAQARLTFAYEAAWREEENAFPLSLSMPLAAGEHGHRVIECLKAQPAFVPKRPVLAESVASTMPKQERQQLLARLLKL